ncbi:hypothetical protein SY85_23170 [Flavisolibacter tropicus]|uniref:Uncharacterized protein n=1 Tax=Flavisolibacter tropicus TaxID=1492898 RepID=A0A172U1E9_9BACT|nr:hypothetical protein SY85_23170 [Flavisolibacter tropicus]
MVGVGLKTGLKGYVTKIKIKKTRFRAFFLWILGNAPQNYKLCRLMQELSTNVELFTFLFVYDNQLDIN